jgi:uncharacterized protein
LKYILDGMLGNLARWLRMMGHDTLYSTRLGDAELLSIAKAEKRVLLTRDLVLYQQSIAKGIEAYYIEGTNGQQYLIELFKRFGIALTINLSESRCPKCNGKLAAISAEQASGKVEKNTMLHYNEFWQCPDCSSVYWQGSHWTKIRQTLKEAKEEVEKGPA